MEVCLCIGNADCPPSWYPKFVISGGFNLLHWMRDPDLFISVVPVLYEKIKEKEKAGLIYVISSSDFQMFSTVLICFDLNYL